MTVNGLSRKGRRRRVIFLALAILASTLLTAFCGWNFYGTRTKILVVDTDRGEISDWTIWLTCLGLALCLVVSFVLMYRQFGHFTGLTKTARICLWLVSIIAFVVALLILFFASCVANKGPGGWI